VTLLCGNDAGQVVGRSKGVGMAFVDHKLGNIPTGSEDNTEVVFRTLSLVVFREFPPKAMGFDADDRVLALVEIPLAAEHLYGDGGCLDVFAFAEEHLIAEVLEQFGLAGRVGKDRRHKHRT
jgi:hypothetical protein